MSERAKFLVIILLLICWKLKIRYHGPENWCVSFGNWGPFDQTCQ